MHDQDHETLSRALAWLQAGHGVLLATVLRTWGSSPRPPGSMMALRDDGQTAGSVSGGCIEDDLVARRRAGELPSAAPALTRYGGSAEAARRFGLPCGGTVELVLEPLSESSALPELLAAVARQERVRRRLDLASGRVEIVPAADGDTLHFDGSLLQTVHGPGLRLILIGAGQLSRCLAPMAQMLGYAVTVCDPREEYHDGWDTLPGATLTRTMPDDLVLAMHPDAHTAVVALTHDPKLDDLALMEALKTPAFYVGALGSRRSHDARRKRLLEFDLDAAQIARLHGPVGLNLGGRTPPEIALAIAAEMTAVRRGAVLGGPLADWLGGHAGSGTS